MITPKRNSHPNAQAEEQTLSSIEYSESEVVGWLALSANRSPRMSGKETENHYPFYQQAREGAIGKTAQLNRLMCV